MTMDDDFLTEAEQQNISRWDSEKLIICFIFLMAGVFLYHVVAISHAYVVNEYKVEPQKTVDVVYESGDKLAACGYDQCDVATIKNRCVGPVCDTYYPEMVCVKYKAPCYEFNGTVVQLMNITPVIPFTMNTQSCVLLGNDTFCMGSGV